MKSLYRFTVIAGLVMCISFSMAPKAHATTIRDLQDAINALNATVTAQAAQISALQATDTAQAAQISALQAEVASIKNSSVYALKDYLTVDTSSTIENATGLKGPHIIFTGANVHIRSGAGSTDEGQISDQYAVFTGLGNLVVGYNEPQHNIELGNPDLTGRGGSHNLIVGIYNKYESYGGFVAGAYNHIIGALSSVSGGASNTARGLYSSISGGGGNIASGLESCVSGGGGNTASELNSSVSGGNSNTASGPDSSVSGGVRNIASGPDSSVSGGSFNIAGGPDSSVSGGYVNTASGTESSVSGGGYNTASMPSSSVSGGRGVTDSDDFGWAAGGTNPNPLNATPPPWYSGSPFLGTYHTP